MPSQGAPLAILRHMEPRPRRKRLIPAWLVPSLIAIILVLSAGAVLARANYLASLVTTPDVVGRPFDIAVDSLSLQGLGARQVSTRFSSEVPEGSVISQDPAAASRVRQGTIIEIVVSAGAEQITLPDLVGSPLNQARERLTALGLGITVRDVMSEAEAGTVLETFPAPGDVVRTGTSVRLSVSSGGSVGDSLLPYDLSGLVVAIDAAPVTVDDPDTPLEISRRLQALLEASGATVTVSRSVTASTAAVTERASILASPTPDAGIGLTLSARGDTGVTTLSLAAAPVQVRSDALARTFTGALNLPSGSVNAVRTGDDPVLGKLLAPAVRVELGDPSSADDVTGLRDPVWADAVARALYRAIGETFGTR